MSSAVVVLYRTYVRRNRQRTQARERRAARRLRTRSADQANRRSSDVSPPASDGLGHRPDAEQRLESVGRRSSEPEVVSGESMRSRRRPWRAGEPGRGSVKARQRDGLHQAGCMLYWARVEEQEPIVFANSDRAMVVFFCRFLRQSLGVAREEVTVRLNVYTSNGLTLREIEDHWLERWTCRGHRSASTRSITSQPRVAADGATSSRTGSARSASAGAPRLSSTSTARSRSTAASRSHGGLTARRRNHEPVGSAPPASRAAARAAPSGREGGSRPGPRPRSARRRGVPR